MNEEKIVKGEIRSITYFNRENNETEMLYTEKYVNELKQQNEFLTKRENKLQTIEQMFKSGSVDLDKLRKIVSEEE